MAIAATLRLQPVRLPVWFSVGALFFGVCGWKWTGFALRHPLWKRKHHPKRQLIWVRREYVISSLIINNFTTVCLKLWHVVILFMWWVEFAELCAGDTLIGALWLCYVIGLNKRWRRDYTFFYTVCVDTCVALRILLIFSGLRVWLALIILYVCTTFSS